MKEVTTPWFQAQRPVRTGVYQRIRASDMYIDYAYWTGERWGLGMPTPFLARQFRDYPSYLQRLPWRGLTRVTKAP